MYAILQHGGKQYQIEQGKTIRIEKINLPINKNIEFNNILMFSNNGKTQIGQPNLSNIKIIGNIIQHGKYKKINIIKFHRRKHYKKKQGHRQHFTDVKIINMYHI
ncbi:50S ribosomal protein L21 [Buchnera aphidicola]|uniref:Large ribosomal subunit protein bL21 n=1 Tax=Buchnera aphidicola (Stegophylla sp.) TaxID=2315800 RepID=A0A4D6YL94_9GAMM|nr:50S ribosomal protein L21 [Buchnera aphidicola (Stegophylla sp.)]QCI26408.1 50S ribosomal protein L21 [Buchnera aphidicola (Stegophylla sp.)]